MVRLFVLAAAALLPVAVDSKTVTIHNDQPRLAVDGSYVDAHDGKIVYHNGTYFLYGESYGNQTMAEPYPWKTEPRLLVYTSPDLVHWTCRGEPLPMVGGTQWIPNVIFDNKTNRFIMWLGAGGWRSATSDDGIHFTPSKYGAFASRFGPSARTDGTGLFVDDDGTGYVIFASNPDFPGGCPPEVTDCHHQGHFVSIERLSDDLLTTSQQNVSGIFPDDYVESPSLFKRKGVYYATYGSCCCGCQEGGGQVVFTAPSIHGPWTRQAHADINCRDASAPVCGGYGKRAGQAAELVYPAQWWGVSTIPLASGGEQLIFNGRRWLSGPNHPEGCHDICGNKGDRASCRSSTYYLHSDMSVWYPLEFDDSTGAILPFKELPSYTLDIA